MPANSKQRVSAWLKRRKLTVAVSAWIVVLAILAFSSSSVTVREQIEIDEALPQLSSAMGDVAGLMSGQDYSFAVGPLKRDRACSVTPVRGGVEYSRSLHIYAGEHADALVAENLYDGLVDRYELETAPSKEGALRYEATLPDFIDYELRASDGVVEWTASTGCRPVGDEVAPLLPVYDPPAEIVAILGDLNVKSADWSKSSVVCGDLNESQGQSRSVFARAKLGDDTDADLSVLKERIPSDGELIVAQKDLFAYRVGGMSWSVVLVGDEITVMSTSECSEAN